MVEDHTIWALQSCQALFSVLAFRALDIPPSHAGSQIAWAHVPIERHAGFVQAFSQDLLPDRVKVEKVFDFCRVLTLFTRVDARSANTVEATSEKCGLMHLQTISNNGDACYLRNREYRLQPHALRAGVQMGLYVLPSFRQISRLCDQVLQVECELPHDSNRVLSNVQVCTSVIALIFITLRFGMACLLPLGS